MDPANLKGILSSEKELTAYVTGTPFALSLPHPLCACTVHSRAETPTRPWAQGPWAPRNGRRPTFEGSVPTPGKNVSGDFTERSWALGRKRRLFGFCLFNQEIEEN